MISHICCNCKLLEAFFMKGYWGKWLYTQWTLKNEESWKKFVAIVNS